MKTGPFIHSGRTTSVLMTHTLLALLPVIVASVWRYGFDAALLFVVTISFSVLTEFIFSRRMLAEGSVLIIGIIFALLLPANTPWWIAALGAVIAIGLGKYCFGGLGQNVFNPAVLSRVILTGVLPVYFLMPRWPIDGTTQATPLAKEIDAVLPSLQTLIFGSHPGALAQAFPLAIVSGGLILLVLRIIDWRVPLYYFATISLFALILPVSERISGHVPYLAGNPLLHLLSGGTLLTGFFILTDPVTSPFSSKGRISFAILAGLYTMIIRYYTPYPDGALFAVLLANAMVPAMDKYFLTQVNTTSPINIQSGQTK